MNETLKWIVGIVLLLVLGVCLFFYFSFAGLPWVKWMVAPKVIDYLEQKYEQSFEIEKRTYNFKDGKYGIIAYPKGQKELTFHASQGYGEYKYVDYYAEVQWEREATNEFLPIVEQNFPKFNRFHVSSVYGEGMDNKVNGPLIPHYKELPIFLTLFLSFNIPFDEEDISFDLLYEIVKRMQEAKGEMELHLYFEVDDDNKNSRSFTLTPYEVKNIKNVDDVREYFYNGE